MRKTASEVLRNLEIRVARLEKSSSRYGRRGNYVLEQAFDAFARHPFNVTSTFKAGTQKAHLKTRDKLDRVISVLVDGRSWGDEKWVWEAFEKRGTDQLVWVLTTKSKNFSTGEVEIGVDFQDDTFFFFVNVTPTINDLLYRWEYKYRMNRRGDVYNNFRKASNNALSHFTSRIRDSLVDTIIPEGESFALPESIF